MKRLIFNSFLMLGLCAVIPASAQDKWERVFLSPDQSTLAHDLVASYDPISHAWEGFSLAQSPLGRFLVPKILSMHTGHIYTLIDKSSVADQNLLSHQWLPWLLKGENPTIEVKRATGDNEFMAKVHLKKGDKGLAVLEFDKYPDHYYRSPSAVTYVLDRAQNRLVFTWQDYLMTVSFSPAARLELCQEPEPLIRKFEGFRDVVLVDHSIQTFFDRNGSVYAGVTFQKDLDIRITVCRKAQPQPAPVSIEKLAANEKKYYTDFLEQQVPVLKTTDPVLRDTYYFAWATFLSNSAQGGYGMAPHPFESSSKYMYPAAFYWDEAFHSIIFSYLKNGDQAYQFLRNFAYSQANDGAMPGAFNITGDHEQYMAKANASGSGDMQPPILSIMLPEVKKRVGWPKDLPYLYEVLTKNIAWYYSKVRDSDGDGLLEYTDSFASGCDNSPRWDNQYLPGVKIGPMHAVEAVDLNVWLVNLHYLLADMADALDKKEEAAASREKGALLAQRIEQLMWDEKDGFYYDLQAAGHEKIRVKTPLSFAVLHLPHANPARIKRMVNEHLLNPKEFWTPYPLPCVAANEKTFKPKDMWRGPVWININWIVADGLAKQGFLPEATALSKKTVALTGARYRNGKRLRSPRFNEYFDPLTGSPLGNENLTWSCLVIDLIRRFL